MKDIFEVVDEKIEKLGYRITIKRALHLFSEDKELREKISEDIGQNVSVVFNSEKYKYIIVEMSDYKDRYESEDGTISKYKAVVFENGKYKTTHTIFSTIENAILDTLAYLHEGIDRRATIYAAQLLGLVK